MNYSTNLSESSQSHAALNEMLLHLKSRLLNLKVMDQNEQQVGWVKDLVLAPNGQLSLVIAEPAESPVQFFLLNSKLIQNIEYQTQSVFINLNFSRLQALPKYNLNQIDNLTQLSSTENDPSFNMNDYPELQSTQETTQEVIRLLEERLVIERGIQKVGEVIVRKEVETEIIEVPIRREKLIIEQAGEEGKQLAEIDLSREQVKGLTGHPTGDFKAFPTVKGTFKSPQAAGEFLKAIISQPDHSCIEVHLEITVRDVEHQVTYQEWCARYSQNS